MFCKFITMTITSIKLNDMIRREKNIAVFFLQHLIITWIAVWHETKEENLSAKGKIKMEIYSHLKDVFDYNPGPRVKQKMEKKSKKFTKFEWKHKNNLERLCNCIKHPPSLRWVVVNKHEEEKHSAKL